MNNPDKAGFAEVSCAADRIAPVLEHVQAYQRQLHFRRVTVMHANQRGGASASALADVSFVYDYDLAGFSFREVECDRGSHYACAENYDVGGCGVGSRHRGGIRWFGNS